MMDFVLNDGYSTSVTGFINQIHASSSGIIDSTYEAEMD